MSLMFLFAVGLAFQKVANWGLSDTMVLIWNGRFKSFLIE